MKMTGTLRFVDVEGGAWLLAADGGRKWQLSPAPHGYKDGDRVHVDGEPDPGGVSLQMAGPILRVHSIRKA